MPERGGAFAPPHDDRYGRLFPDGDVGNILAGVIAKHFGRTPEGVATKMAEIDLDELACHFTLPVGEPMFLLRPGDPFAVAALRDHLEECQGQGAPREYIEGVVRAIHSFERWKAARAESGD